MAESLGSSHLTLYERSKSRGRPQVQLAGHPHDEAVLVAPRLDEQSVAPPDIGIQSSVLSVYFLPGGGVYGRKLEAMELAKSRSAVRLTIVHVEPRGTASLTTTSVRATSSPSTVTTTCPTT